jgi:hypothetical protein
MRTGGATTEISISKISQLRTCTFNASKEASNIASKNKMSRFMLFASWAITSIWLQLIKMGQPVSQISCDILTDYLAPNITKLPIGLAVWLKGDLRLHSFKTMNMP